MKKESIELLIKDLSAKMMYNVKGCYDNSVKTINYIEPDYYEIRLFGFNFTVAVEDVKPYLRPMSSMTAEERKELHDILGGGIEVNDDFMQIIDSSVSTISFLELQAMFDWLNSHYFDYLGLIPKKLAIAVTEDNNPYKQ